MASVVAKHGSDTKNGVLTQNGFRIDFGGQGSSDVTWNITYTDDNGCTANYNYTVKKVDEQRRWVDSGNFVCDGVDKYSQEKEQISYDGGSTWSDTGNTRRGSLIERNSADCGYVPPISCEIISISVNPTESTIEYNHCSDAPYIQEHGKTKVTIVSQNCTAAETKWEAHKKNGSDYTYVTSGNNEANFAPSEVGEYRIRSIENTSITTTYKIKCGEAPQPTFENYIQVFINSSDTYGGHHIDYDRTSVYFKPNATQRVDIDTTFYGTLALNVSGYTNDGFEGTAQFVIEDYQKGTMEIESVESQNFVKEGYRYLWNISALAHGAQGTATINLVRGGTLQLRCYLM